MNIQSNKLRLIFFLFGTLLILFLFFLISNIFDNRSSIILYYVNPLTDTLEKEERKMLFQFTSTKEKIIVNVLNEYLIGPKSIDLRNLSPQNTRVTSCKLRYGTLYVNLNRYYLLEIKSQNERMFIKGLLKTIAFNFKDIKKVHFTFGGRELEYIKGNVNFTKSFSLRQNKKKSSSK